MSGFEPIGAALRNRLLAFPAFASLGIKVQALKISQNGVPPVVTFTLISDIPFDTIEGMASLYRAIVEFKTWSKDTDQASKFDEIIRLALQGYKGQNLGVSIKGIHHLHSMDDFEAEVNEYNKISRYSVLYDRVNTANDE